MNAWQMMWPFSDPRHASPSVAATIADTWSLHDNRASPGTVSSASSEPCVLNNPLVGVHSNVGHVPHVAGQLFVGSTVLPSNLNAGFPHLSAMSAHPNWSASERQSVVSRVVTVVDADVLPVVLPVDVAVDVGVGLARIDVAVVVAVDEMLVVAVDVGELVADVVALVVAVDVAELVAVLVSEDVAVARHLSHIAGHAASTTNSLEPTRILAPHFPLSFLHPKSSSLP